MDEREGCFSYSRVEDQTRGVGVFMSGDKLNVRRKGCREDRLSAPTLSTFSPNFSTAVI